MPKDNPDPDPDQVSTQPETVEARVARLESALHRLVNGSEGSGRLAPGEATALLADLRDPAVIQFERIAAASEAQLKTAQECRASLYGIENLLRRIDRDIHSMVEPEAVPVKKNRFGLIMRLVLWATLLAFFAAIAYQIPEVKMFVNQLWEQVVFQVTTWYWTMT